MFKGRTFPTQKILSNGDGIDSDGRHERLIVDRKSFHYQYP
jgi:hypothetical protein